MSDDTTATSGEQATAVRDRRAVLRGAAVAGLAGVGAPLLAACGDDGTAGGSPTAPSSSSAPTTGNTPSGPASTPPATTPSAGGPVLGPAADIPVGGGKAYPDAKLIVTQPTAGQFKGFSAMCTHAGCAMKDVANGTINCNCHGSKFAIADGTVKAGPAKDPLPTVNVTVQGGNLIGPA